MICPECGNQLEKNSSKCKKCGWSASREHLLIDDNPDSPDGGGSTRQKKIPLYAIILIACAAVLIVIVAVALIINAFKPDEKVHIHNMEHYPAVSATCSRNGNIEYWYCDECGNYYSDEAGDDRVDYNSGIVVTAEHSFTVIRNTSAYHWYECERCHSEDVEKRHYGGKATCTAKANCELCGYPYGEVDASNHSGGTYTLNSKAPTETAAGYSGDVYCKGCNALLHTGKATTLKNNTAANHMHTAKSYWNSDKTQHWKNCIECYTRLYTAAHTFGSYSYNGDATTAKDGTKTRSCTVCGYKETVTASGTKLNSNTTTPQKPSAPVTSTGFTDVPQNAWYKSYVDYAVKNGIFGGKGNGKFEPNSGITRAEFVQVLANLSGVDCSDSNVGTVFTDVKRGSWYTAAVKWAHGNRIVSGTSTTKFSPSAKITREQMCVMIINYVHYRGIELHYYNRLSRYSDDSEISDWAKDAVYLCQRAGLINGKGGNEFCPDDYATRAEAAVAFSIIHENYL